MGRRRRPREQSIQPEACAGECRCRDADARTLIWLQGTPYERLGRLRTGEAGAGGGGWGRGTRGEISIRLVGKTPGPRRRNGDGRSCTSPAKKEELGADACRVTRHHEMRAVRLTRRRLMQLAPELFDAKNSEFREGPPGLSRRRGSTSQREGC